jgi:ferredoxin
MELNVIESERVSRPRPRLPFPETPGSSPRPSEIALELRRFHAASPTQTKSPKGLRSAAIVALEATRTPPEVEATLVQAEGELGPDDRQDLAEARTTHLLRVAARKRLLPRRDGFLVEVRGLARRVRERLDVERAKDEAREPDRLEQSVSPAGAEHFDFGTLSNVIGTPRGTVRLRPEERKRVRAALDALESFDFAPGDPLARIVHDGSFDLDVVPGVEIETAEDPAQAALEIFDRDLIRLTDVLRATRIARLVLDNAFDEARHGPWLDRFGPSSFRSEELLLVPVVAAIENIDALEGKGLRSFSRLLLSGRPVHLMMTGSPRRSPRLSQSGDVRERLEPAYLAMGHRKAFTQQSSVGNASHFLTGLLASLDHARPALHMLDEASGPDDALAAQAALASRAHPCFRYDPAAGSSWAGRLDFSGNPAPDSPWPVANLDYETEDGTVEALELPVTFADYLLEDPATRAHLRPIPAGCPEDALSPLRNWLELDEDEALLHVPWLWAIDPAGDLLRVAVTRRLALVCRERADFWHTLQELAGVRNEYVTEAVHRARSEGELAAAAERDRMRTEHAEQLAGAKRKAVEEAMSHLARRLLDLDPGAIPAAAVTARTAEGPAPAAESVAATAESEAPPAPAETDEDEEVGEPWIDTPLCTSCNDCTDINPHLFKYDANKQAVMGDLRSGTFAQVVQAAEKCPAKCIHPGAPWNGDEPGLDGLLQRAQPFQ